MGVQMRKSLILRNNIKTFNSINHRFHKKRNMEVVFQNSVQNFLNKDWDWISIGQTYERNQRA